MFKCGCTVVCVWDPGESGDCGVREEFTVEEFCWSAALGSFSGHTFTCVTLSSTGQQGALDLGGSGPWWVCLRF